MFGYIRPLKGELKVREYESYRALYCGMCHTLSRRCGPFARLTVNYDFTFLAMLLWETDDSLCYVRRRCVVSPFRKKRCCSAQTAALEQAADRSMILSWWQLQDSRKDGGFWKSLAAGLGLLVFRIPYRRAARRAERFDAVVRSRLAALAALEQAHCSSIDQAADCFAEILRAAAADAVPEKRRRILEQLLYHTGRVIYLLDAVDDLPDDIKTDNYNPLRYRFALEKDALNAAQKQQLRLTLRHSLNCMSAAFQLLDRTPWSEIVENILYQGIPVTAEQVLAGIWGHSKRNEDGATI